MTTNLLNLASNEFRGDVVNRIAETLRESNASLQSALGGALPALIGGLAERASTGLGAGQVLDVLKSQFAGGQVANVADAVSSPSGMSNLIETGTPLVSSLLGGRAHSIIDWVTSLGGIKRSSASSLLGLGMPVILGLIGRHLGGNMNVSSLMSFMGDQKSYLRDAPAGLDNALRGETDFGMGAPQPGEPARISQTGRSDWWKWAVPVIAGLALLGYVLSRREAPRVAVNQPTPSVTMPTPAPPVTQLPRAEIREEKILPDGITIKMPSNSMESKLIAFIEDPNMAANTGTVFIFDQLEFDTDSATLKPGSEEQLRNIAEILKAYPNVTLKIDGYTDNVGSSDSNLTLSRERATHVMKDIAAKGVNPSRLSAEGHGDQSPIADNSTEEGRQQNRRITVQVTGK